MIDFQAMMGDAPNPYMVLNRDLRFVWVNAAYERATMRQKSEIVGRHLFEAFPPPDEKAHRQLSDSIARAFQTGMVDELAFIEYAMRSPDGSMETFCWSATHTPLFNKSGDVAYVLQHTVNISELGPLRRMSEGTGLLERARAVEQRFQDASAEAALLRDLLEQAPGFVTLLNGPDHRFVMANAAYRRLIGERDVIGLPLAEALPEVADQGFIDLLDEVLASGRPYIGERDKIALLDPVTGSLHDRYLEFVYQPIVNARGTVSGVFVQGHDVTEQVEADERQRLLINELNHRVKNTLAVVQGLAQQSFGADADGRFGRFSARLTALAGAHNLLTAATWEAADLRSLLLASLEATTGVDVARCTLEGPMVTLPPQLAVAFAMIIHELSTNAIKYGALSNGVGTVAIRWNTALAGEQTELTLKWCETGGPTVVPPTREGFGTRLIRRGLGGPGHVELDYRPHGFHCCIEARL